VNWWCNGLRGCLLIPSLKPCEAGKSATPPARIITCIRRKLDLPEPVAQCAQSTAPRQNSWWDDFIDDLKRGPGPPPFPFSPSIPFPGLPPVPIFP
jgi:hypothetical protein